MGRQRAQPDSSEASWEGAGDISDGEVGCMVSKAAAPRQILTHLLLTWCGITPLEANYARGVDESKWNIYYLGSKNIGDKEGPEEIRWL